MSCAAPYCRNPVTVVLLNLDLCDSHWLKVCEVTDRELPHDCDLPCEDPVCDCKPQAPLTQKQVKSIIRGEQC